MIGNKLEQEILGIYNRDITAVLSINQIAKKLNKAYPYINSKVNALIRQGVLKKVQVARSNLCSINLDSNKAIALLSLNEAIEREKLLSKTQFREFEHQIKDLSKNFKIDTIFFSKSKVCFILDHIYDKEAIKNQLKQKKYDLIFYTKEFFQKELLENKSLLDKIVLYSPDKYFEIVNQIRNQLEFLKNE